MRIKLTKETATEIGLKLLEKEYNCSELGWTHRDAREIDLSDLNGKQLTRLEALLQKHEKLKGVFVALWDIKVWREAQTNPQAKQARNAQQFAVLLKALLSKYPGHRIFRKEEESWWCYYVDKITYVPRESSRDRMIPAHVNIHLVWEEFEGRNDNTIVVWEEDCARRIVTRVLAEQNIHLETPELREMYLAQRAKWETLVPQIGLQLEVYGLGDDSGMDGNPGSSDSWYRQTSHTYALGTKEFRSRAILDVFYEKAKKEREESKVFLDLFFWGDKRTREADNDDDERSGNAGMENTDDQDNPPPKPEIPIHPTLAIFDLTRHLRLWVHVDQAEVHKYDRDLADKLVLPPEMKSLVMLLIEHQAGSFKDIIAGKSGGAVVMLAGPPGTGKTLTAEVYAESEGRALYSVQCSQLGTKPETLENELLKVFGRGARWHAVILLDEADVYVHTRGQSLQQNAIVGVFLRVLEYQSTVFFLTTNRPDDVDDAIASRCIAKLVYKVPSPEDQGRIWRILADTTDCELPGSSIKEIIKANPKLSGRDVKNLLKLAILTSKGEKITPEMVEFVKQFKPA